jgi:hypothetical protein
MHPLKRLSKTCLGHNNAIKHKNMRPPRFSHNPPEKLKKDCEPIQGGAALTNLLTETIFLRPCNRLSQNKIKLKTKLKLK